MALNLDPISCKASFLKKNQSYSEIELNDESKPIGKLHEFDLLENEVWLLQCPKGMDVTKLENQKLKIPGRTHFNNSEAISMEFIEGNEQHAFAYCNRKRRYDLRLLPVRGTIVLRNRLKAAETVTEEFAEKYCSTAERVSMPPSVRVRHPLLGVKYEDKLELDKSIAKRLQQADKISAEILKESLNRKSKIKFGSTRGKQEKTNIPIYINSDNDEDIVFVSEEKLKKKQKKNKRKCRENSEMNDSGNTSEIQKKKHTKTNTNEKEFVSKDLQWLQNI